MRKFLNRYHFEYILLLTLLFVAAILRFYILPSTLWMGDSARDLIVSNHILHYHEYPLVGHMASGTNPIFFYPPLYYYLLAFVQIPSTNIWYVLSLQILMNVIGIGALYFITKNLSSSLSAFLSTILFTFSSYFIDKQTTLLTEYFVLPIFLIGTLLHLKGIKDHSLKIALTGLLLIIIASSISYAGIILIPVYIFWMILFFKDSLANILYIFIATISTFAFIFSSFAFYEISKYGLVHFLLPFSPMNNLMAVNLFSSLSTQLVFLFSIVFPKMTMLILLALFCIIILNIRITPSRIFAFAYPISFIVVTVILASMKNVPIAPHYYYFIGPLIFVLFGICFDKKNPKILNIICLTVIIISLFSCSFNINAVFKRKNTYNEASKIADEIVFNLRRLDLLPAKTTNVRWVALSTYNFDGETTRYVYFLEKSIGKVYTIDNDSIYNLNWNGKPQYIVLICLIDETTNTQWCKQNISEIYPSASFLTQLSQNDKVPIFLYKN